MADPKDTLQKLLKKDFALVLSHIFILKEEVDLICSDNTALNAIEVKSKLSEIPQAIGTCSYYKQGVHKTYIALPEKEIKNITNEKRILKEMGIGLISFSKKDYAILLESKESNPEKSVLKSVLGNLRLTKEIREAAHAYKALAHPTRLRIYLAVCRSGAAKLKDIAEEHGGCYPLLMKHIKILEESNLIESEHFKKETTLKLKSHPVTVKDIISNQAVGR